MRTTKKLGLVGAMAVAIVFAMAMPAAAAGPFPLETTGGTLNTAIGSFDLTPGSQGTPPCPDKASTLALTTDVPSAGRYSVTGTFSGQFQLPAGSGNWYWANFTILSGSGTYSGSSPYALTGTLVVRVELSPVNVNDCASKAPLACRVTGQFAINSATSTYTGTLPNAVTGDFTSIDATTTSGLVASPCSPPFTALGGSAASLAGLQLTVQ